MFLLIYFKPLFIDHYLTKPARGELAKNILDHVSNLSKDLNTILSVNRYNNTATLIKNTHTSQKTNYKCLSQLKNGILVYDEESSQLMYQYDLIRVGNMANLSSLANSNLWS